VTGLDTQINGVEIHLPPSVTAPLVVERLRDGSYEADEANAAERCVKDGFRVLELGAGIGYVTAICARRTAPENVLAVEANPALIPVIESNLARNGAQGVTVLHGAVVARAEEGQKASHPSGCRITFPASRLASEGGRIVDVPMIGFHDLLRAHRPHVVLMDIEGAETQLFDRPWKCPLAVLRAGAASPPLPAARDQAHRRRDVGHVDDL
jgi:FkbM family methyltransferase